MSTSGSPAAGSDADTLRHEALLYRSGDEYAETVLSFVHDGLAAGEPTFVAVPGPRADLLRNSLNGAAERVRFTDMTQLGGNPSRIIPAIRRFCDDHAGSRVRFVGEPIWPGRSAAEIAEATRHEALVNLAFAQANALVLCPYDVCGLTSSVLADAARTHPDLVERGVPRHSPQFTDPLVMYDAEAWPLPSPPADAVVVQFDLGSLAWLRRLVEQQAGAAGLAEDRIADLLLAINEVATNTLVHGSRRGTLRIWPEPRSLVCEVQDGGHIVDPLAGRHRPSRHATGGRGLWLVNHLCDLVETRSGATGTTIRLHISR